MINFEKMILEYSDKYADFAASTVAFMESQKREICAETIAQKIPPEKRAYFEARLAHYRSIYKAQTLVE
ncbi:DNA polymerase III subunit theta [Symbiopectobacterium sp. RP]|uniref:DNA polymerase III subunit theta n=1 Tax=unclassified Symbiopectobacterium TaxID=2794573 RepID=UPI003D285F18